MLKSKSIRMLASTKVVFPNQKSTQLLLAGVSIPRERLIVGVDYGTTFSGKLKIIEGAKIT